MNPRWFNNVRLLYSLLIFNYEKNNTPRVFGFVANFKGFVCQRTRL
jgi:hypothetical protein